jgi:hypothetical protein
MTREVQTSNTSQALILDSPLSVGQNVFVKNLLLQIQLCPIRNRQQRLLLKDIDTKWRRCESDQDYANSLLASTGRSQFAEDDHIDTCVCRKRYMTRFYRIRDSSLSGQMPPAVMKRPRCYIRFDVLDRCVIQTGEQSCSNTNEHTQARLERWMHQSSEIISWLK